MAFKLPKLKYAFDALEPVIDAKTMEIHYSKHHNAYVTNLNSALEVNHPEGLEVPVAKLLMEFKHLPSKVQAAVQNHGGGHANHTLFWETLSATKNKPMPSKLEEVFVKHFGGVSQFKEAFENTAKTRFGSGWAWLVYDPDNKLRVISTPNQDSPLMAHLVPILGLDVWEHAYYLQYQNRRAEYVANFWSVVDWDIVYTKYIEASSCYNNHAEPVGCCG